MDVLVYMFEQREKIVRLTGQHLELTFVAVFLATLLALPLGVLLTRVRWLNWIGLMLVNLGQTIPSLAVLGLMIPFLGIGFKPAVFALVLRAMLPIVINTYVGIMDIDRAVIDAGRGMGMRNWQILRMVELPLALPVIMAGFRNATVMSISIATLAALIGAGGLGDLIFQGMAMVDARILMAGAIPTALLAILADLILGKVEVMLIPRGIRG